MKVRAKKLGYYGNTRIREGEVFFIKKEQEFSKIWMEKLEEQNSPFKTELEEKPKAKGNDKESSEVQSKPESQKSVI